MRLVTHSVTIVVKVLKETILNPIKVKLGKGSLTKEAVEEHLTMELDVIFGIQRIRRLVSGYGSGNVIKDLTLSGQDGIYILLTGRWNSIYLITHDRGENKLTRSQIHSPTSNVNVSVEGLTLNVTLTNNAPYILYKVN